LTFQKKQFHFLVQDGDIKIRSPCGGFISLVQIFLSIYAFYYTFFNLMLKNKFESKIYPIFNESFDLSKFNFSNLSTEGPYINIKLKSPNNINREKELEFFFKYFKIVQSIWTSYDGKFIHGNLKILNDSIYQKIEIITNMQIPYNDNIFKFNLNIKMIFIKFQANN